jgi:hypothetical protein
MPRRSSQTKAAQDPAPNARHFAIRLVEKWTNIEGESHTEPRVHIVPLSSLAAEAILKWRNGQLDDAPACVKEIGTFSSIHIQDIGQTLGYRFRPLHEQPAGFLSYIVAAVAEMNDHLERTSRPGG